MRRLARYALLALGVAISLPVLFIGTLNTFLNLWLPLLISMQPQRLEMDWAWAWTWDAQRVEVEGFTLRVQGPMDQWWLSVERGTLHVALRPLLERRFHADDVDAEGVVLRYRTRADAPVREGEAAAVYIEGRTAPIPGLENPPLEPPEELYPPPAAPWLVGLDDVTIDHVREVWLSDLRFVGDASIEGDLIVFPGASLDVSDLRAGVFAGAILQDDIPVLSDVALDLEGSLEGIDPVRDAGLDLLRHLTASIRVGGAVDDLRYIDLFLSDAPWVGISGGSGRLDANFTVEEGVVGPGSVARARVTELTARVGTYNAFGDGRVDIWVDQAAQMAIELQRFSVSQGQGEPLVRGAGFRLDARTGSLRIDAPPSGFTAIATLPRSEVPSLARLSRYLPSDVGIRILSGRATVEGQARIEEDGDRVSGQLIFDAPQARLAVEGTTISGAARIVGKVVRGSLDRGHYDIHGSSFAVKRVAVADKPPTWWARVDVREGHVDTGADTFLKLDAKLACADSSPFFRLAVGDRKVAPWVEEITLLKNPSGDIRASFGQSSLSIDHMHIHAPKSEVHLHLRLDDKHTYALLFARLGVLGVATRLIDGGYTVQLTQARRWFHARLKDLGTPEPMVGLDGKVIDVDEQKRDDRKGIRFVADNLMKIFGKKKKDGKEGEDGEKKPGKRGGRAGGAMGSARPQNSAPP